MRKCKRQTYILINKVCKHKITFIFPQIKTWISRASQSVFLTPQTLVLNLLQNKLLLHYDKLAYLWRNKKIKALFHVCQPHLEVQNLLKNIIFIQFKKLLRQNAFSLVKIDRGAHKRQWVCTVAHTNLKNIERQ